MYFSNLHFVICGVVSAVVILLAQRFVRMLERSKGCNLGSVRNLVPFLVIGVLLLYTFKVAVPGAYREFFAAEPVTFVVERDRAFDGRWVTVIYQNHDGEMLMVTVYNNRTIKYGSGFKLPAEVPVPMPPVRQ